MEILLAYGHRLGLCDSKRREACELEVILRLDLEELPLCLKHYINYAFLDED